MLYKPNMRLAHAHLLQFGNRPVARSEKCNHLCLSEKINLVKDQRENMGLNAEGGAARSCVVVAREEAIVSKRSAMATVCVLSL